jgi:endonuclease/exonuclease/phosphatase family metal-dependent hydrolase
VPVKTKDKRRLGFIDRIFLWINFLLALSLLISYAAPVTSPAVCWPVAFFGLAYPFILLANLIMLLYWVFRKSIWVLLPVLCIAVGWSNLTRTFAFRGNTIKEVKSDSATIRLMTYNVHNFKRFGSGNDVSTKNEILQIINDKQPDIIGFQEFFTRHIGEYDMVDTIQKLLHTNQYYFEALQTSTTEAIGMAIFSKYPIIAHGFIQLSNDHTSENQCLYVDVKKGGKIFRVYSVHLQSVRFDPEDYHYLSEVSGGTNKTNDGGSAKRLGSKLKLAFIKRGHQVETIKARAAGCPYPYIISGDFNDTPESYAVNQMAKGLKNAFVEAGSGLGVTYNGKFPNYQIDYVMCSPAFNVTGYDIVKKRLSDHYPVYCDLILK